jgi:hypothetical protein
MFADPPSASWGTFDFCRGTSGRATLQLGSRVLNEALATQCEGLSKELAKIVRRGPQEFATSLPQIEEGMYCARASQRPLMLEVFLRERSSS